MTDRAAGYRSFAPVVAAQRSPAAPPPQPLPDALVGAVDVLRGMAYEHRLHILVLLMDGESTPDALAAAMSLEGTVVSHHLRNLRDTSLIRRQRRGRNVYYSLSGEPARRLVAEVLRYTEK